MGKNLIVHIGGSKCGSSAIQDYLATNHAQMMENGVLTPDQDLAMDGPFTAEQIFLFADLATQDQAKDILHQKFSALCEVMEAKDQKTLIVSAENLSVLGNMPQVLAEATISLFEDIRVIFYIRRQDDYLISAWQQWGLKSYPDMASYIASEGQAMADWSTHLSPWETAFGQARISVRPFRRDLLAGGDVVEDFLSVLNLPHEGAAPLKVPSNPSFDEHLGDMAHRINDIFEGPHDNEFYDLIGELLEDQVRKSRSGSHLMTLSERLELLAGFEAGNEAVKQRYLPKMGDAPLFIAPTQADVVTVGDWEKQQKETDILMRVCFAMAQRIELLERRPTRHSLKYLLKRSLGLLPPEKAKK